MILSLIDKFKDLALQWIDASIQFLVFLVWWFVTEKELTIWNVTSKQLFEEKLLLIIHFLLCRTSFSHQQRHSVSNVTNTDSCIHC